MKTTIFTILMSVLLFTGCFGPSDEEAIISEINKKFELINKSDITLLVNNENSIEVNVQNMTDFNECLMRINPNVLNTLLELNEKSRSMGAEVSQIAASVSKKFKKDFAKAEGNFKEFQKVLLSFKNELIEKNFNPELLEVMFGGETLKASTKNEYRNGIILNTGINKTLRPLSNTYVQESIICVKDVSGLIPLKKIEKISIDGNDANVTLLLDNNKTSIVKLEKVKNKWIFK